MSPEAKYISTDEEICAKIPADVLVAWDEHQATRMAVHKAASDRCIQTVAGLLIAGYCEGDEDKESNLKGSVENLIVDGYGVPLEKVEDVFQAAEEIMWEEMANNGEA